jgi:hypothetical protein
MNDIDEKSRATPTALDRALELAADVEAFNLYKCSIGDDLEKHWGYIYAFLDTVRPFAAAVKRIGDPDLSEQISGLNLDDVNYIYEAYTLKASLQGIIDHLREVSADPTYGASVKANVAFLEPSVLAALRNAKSQQFDYAKLIRLCEELNDAYGRANYLSCALLIRAVMNHVPPVFGCQTFAQVTAQCGKSLKAVFERLEDSARPIADLHTHALIRAKESVPTKHQVEPYKASFELLMQEVIARA